MAENKLVSVESQTEYSLNEGKQETRIFVKVYVDAAKAGLIADMGAENWQTLCIIASFMDKNGECYPTQSQIAKRLGVSRQTANRRVNRLADYRWNGKPLIKSVKDRHTDGKFDNTRYTILPISQITIFENEPEPLG